MEVKWWEQKKTLVSVSKGQDPYSVIGNYISNHVTAIEDMIAAIQINGAITKELYMVDMDADGYFYWKNDWWEGEEDVALLDFFPVSDAERIETNDSMQPDPHYDEWCTDCKEYDQERHCCPRWNRVIRQTVNEMKVQQQWIPCSERLPEKDDLYIVCFDKGNLRENETQVEIAYWLNGEWQYSCLESYEHRMPKLVIEPLKELSVAAWMPLPEPYQPSEHSEMEVKSITISEVG